MNIKPLLILFLVGLLLFFSCAAPRQTLRPGAKIEALHVFLETSPLIPISVKEGFSKELDDFISQHNSKPHKFSLLRVNRPGISTLSIKIHEMRFVTQGQ